MNKTELEQHCSRMRTAIGDALSKMRPNGKCLHDRSRVRVTRYTVPDSIDVKKLRERLGMSQPEFAIKFGFSLGTLRQWEQGRRAPDGPARVLLTVISHSPDAVNKALEKETRKVTPQPRIACG